MSFFDDIGHAVGSFVDHEGKALLHFAEVPLGSAVDIAQGAWEAMPGTPGGFDDALHDTAHKLAGEGSALVAPFVSTKTWSGQAVHDTLHAMNYAYNHAIDRPIGAAQLLTSHIQNQYGWDPSGFKDYFNGADWQKAWEEAKQQNGNALGGAFASNFLEKDKSNPSRNEDPFQHMGVIHSQGRSVPRLWAQVDRDHPVLAPILAGGSELAVGWFLDPTVVAGKAAGIAHTELAMGKLGAYDRPGLMDHFEAMAKDNQDKLKIADMTRREKRLAARPDRMFDYVAGKNSQRRLLTEDEAFKTSPQFLASSHGRELAGMFHDAVAAGDRTAARTVLASAAGDPFIRDAVRSRSALSQNIADRLNNLDTEGPAKLEDLALAGDAGRHAPGIYAEYNRQLDNLDAVNGDLSKFTENWSARMQKQAEIERSLSTSEETQAGGVFGTLDNLPAPSSNVLHAPLGPLSRESRQLRRINETDVLSQTSKAHYAVEDLARQFANKPRASLFQKGLAQVPLIMVKASNPVTGFYTGRYAKSVADSLRQVRFNGLLNTHAWKDALDQLDSGMRVMHMPNEERAALIQEAAEATDESTKMRVAAKIVDASMRAGRDYHGARVGENIDQAYLEQMVRKNAYKVHQTMAAMKGTTYAATKMPTDMLATPKYQGYIDQANEQAMSNYLEGATNTVLNPAEGQRVDQFMDEQGRLFSMPLDTSQLSNNIVLPDFNEIDRLLKHDETTRRLASFGRSYAKANKKLSNLQALRATAAPHQFDAIDKAIKNVQLSMDATLDAGSLAMRAWKYSVLFRLGYPMRVITEDQFRIGNKLHYMHDFLAPNTKQAVSAAVYNKTARRSAGWNLWKQARFDRDRLSETYGWEGHGQAPATSVANIEKVRDAAKVLAKKRATQAEKDTAQSTLRKLDPDGLIAEHYIHEAEASRLASRVSGQTGYVTRLKNLIENGDVTEAKAAPKLQAAQEKIDDYTAQIGHHQLQGFEKDPIDARKEIDDSDRALTQGPKAFRPEKRGIGETSKTVKVGKGQKHEFSGAFEGEGKQYRGMSSSKETFDTVMQGPEGRYSSDQRRGNFTTYTGDQPGHLGIWADVLNQQAYNGRAMRFFLKNPDATPEEFAEFVHEPENADMLKRLPLYAAAPQDWGRRVKQMMFEYAPTRAIREATLRRQVTPKLLDREVPMADRPSIHGQELDVNDGRSPAVRMVSGAFNKAFSAISDMPTDALSRHPFFNAMYGQKLSEIAKTEFAAAKAAGRRLSAADYYEMERRARQQSLHELKRTLWDVSAHKDAGQALRYISPFFTAHTEALSRWWTIAKEHPDALRKFGMIFDEPAKQGLVYNSKTGEIVAPGTPGLSTNYNDRVLFRIPGANSKFAKGVLEKVFGKKNGAAVAQVLGQEWSTSLSGWDMILQNGIANPGTGPLVSIPVQEIAKKFPGDPTITKFASMIDPYPSSGIVGGVEPGSIRHGISLVHAIENDVSGNDYTVATTYGNNLADLTTQFYKRTGRFPNSKEMGGVARDAHVETVADLALQTASNVGAFTPASPDGQYAVIQRGLQRLYAQAQRQGKSYDWVRKQFKHKYGAAYRPLLYSSNANPADLTGSAAEVAAVKKNAGLIYTLDNASVAKAIIGPYAAMHKQDKGSTAYNSYARNFLERASVMKDGRSLMSQKNPYDAQVAGMEQNGWDAYDHKMNQLQVAAEHYGLAMSDPRVRAIKNQMVAQLGQQNYWWKIKYEQSGTSSGDFDSKVQDLRKVAANRSLRSDPRRSDVKILGDWLEVRDAVTQLLKRNQKAGGSADPAAKQNAVLMSRYSAIVDQMVKDNTYFGSYDYNGLIEFDPYYMDGQDAVASQAQPAPTQTNDFNSQQTPAPSGGWGNFAPGSQ